LIHFYKRRFYLSSIKMVRDTSKIVYEEMLIIK